MARKAKRRRHRAAGKPAEPSVVPQVVSADNKELLPPGENYAVDVAADRIDMDPKRLDRENPVCSLPPERDEAPPDR